MLTVTPAARDRLSEKLIDKKAKDDQAFRFTQRKGGFRLRLGRAQRDDTAFTHEGRTVLLLDEAVTKAMVALALDVRGTESGTKLKLRRVRRGSD